MEDVIISRYFEVFIFLLRMRNKSIISPQNRNNSNKKYISNLCGYIDLSQSNNQNHLELFIPIQFICLYAHFSQDVTDIGITFSNGISNVLDLTTNASSNSDSNINFRPMIICDTRCYSWDIEDSRVGEVLRYIVGVSWRRDGGDVNIPTSKHIHNIIEQLISYVQRCVSDKHFQGKLPGKGLRIRLLDTIVHNINYAKLNRYDIRLYIYDIYWYIYIISLFCFMLFNHNIIVCNNIMDCSFSTM